MIKYFFAAALLFTGCASTTKVEKNSKDNINEIRDTSALKKEALEYFINGSVLETKGDYAAAILEFQEALARDPSAGIYYSIAKNYSYLGKHAPALQYIRKAVELAPQDKEYLRLMGDIYLVTFQSDSAATEYRKIIDIDSTDIPALYRLAGVYEKNKPSEAVKIYNRILDEMGDEWSVLANLAELNEKLGNLDESADNIRRMIAIDPLNSSLKKALAELYQKQKNYDSAASVLDEIIEFTPDDFEARERKAQLYIESGQWKKAGEEYKYLLSLPQIKLDAKIRIGTAYFVQALKDSSLLPTAKEIFTTLDNDTTDWQVKLFLGAISLNEKKEAEAEKYFTEVITLAQYHPEGWIQLGSLYFDNQRYEEAITLLSNAIDTYPDDFAINLLLGLSYAQSGKHQDAREYLAAAVRVNPNEVTALSAYAYTLSQLKENDEAVTYLKRALSISPDDVNLLGTLGLIYDSLEMWEECDSTYERALRIEPDNALVNNNYAYSLSERNLQLERALKMAEIAIAAEPANSSYLDTIGWVYFKLGRYEEAHEYLKKALDVAGERPVILEHLGDVVFMMGKKSEAMDLWQKSFSLDTSNTKLKSKIEKGEI